MLIGGNRATLTLTEGGPVKMTKKKPRRAKGRRSASPDRGYELYGPGRKLWWKVDLLRAFGTKERYAVLRIRRGAPLPSN